MTPEYVSAETVFNREFEAQKEKVRGVSVCLITPPSPFLADERVFPFLAPAKIAAELMRNSNPVELLDLSGYSNFLDVTREYLQDTSIRTFGITATSPQVPAAVAIRDEIKAAYPDAKVILGGPHVTLTHEAMKQNVKSGTTGRGIHDFAEISGRFDKLVAGDGEMAIFYAIDPSDSKTIIDSSTPTSPLFMAKGSLEKFGYPARHMIDLDSYHYFIDGHRAFSLIAQLGCPFECGFCGGRDVAAYRIARTRPIDSISEEIREVVYNSIDRALLDNDPKKVLTGVMFYDDELNVSPANLENLCIALIDFQKKLAHQIPEDKKEWLGLKTEGSGNDKRIAMRFRGFVKAELFSQEQANLMHEAGFRVLLSGIESGSNKILSAMKKHTTREINSRCVTFAHNAGLKFKALMSIGHPGESEETINESIEWVLANLKEGDEVDWTIITQYPGSPYYDQSNYIPEKNAWLFSAQDKTTGEILNLWSRATNYIADTHFYKGIPGQYTAYVWTDKLSSVDLVRLRDNAEQITRSALNMPFIEQVTARHFEHSMGQGLSHTALRKSSDF
ncbi:MAG: Radical SAM domain protein [Candidatus Woesebacteria bacterium GW2011_GWA2_40_7b]|uniref:Radical SAM domain protein n=1 Tax=Candidatus Woesebacteria bacterium GW2011_GWA2_40_7b TaxID=1618563 RepID=A0A0G0T7V9_9BACT|nr:MAG: Radical SAM domain protein [Candidatus Woesebacteria bacterium GW2011_GWA2_40_7b]